MDPFDKHRPPTPDEIECHNDCKKSAGCYGSGADQCKQCKDTLLRVVDTQ